jgi:hypothetical protein
MVFLFFTFSEEKNQSDGGGAGATEALEVVRGAQLLLPPNPLKSDVMNVLAVEMLAT